MNLKGNTLEYRRQIIKLYGAGFDEVLEQRDREVKQYSRQDLEELLVYYKEKIRKLSQE